MARAVSELTGVIRLQRHCLMVRQMTSMLPAVIKAINIRPMRQITGTAHSGN